MIIRTNVLIVAAFLLFQCPNGDQQIGNLGSSKHAPSPFLTSQGESECDFKEFSTLTISHFYPNKVVTAVLPKYSIELARSGAIGWIMVEVLVNKKGEVERACTRKGDPELRMIAEAAAFKWKFKPNFGFEEHESENNEEKNNVYVKAVLPFHFVKDSDDTREGIVVKPSI